MKTAINHNKISKLLCAILTLIGIYSNAQVLDPFTPRLNETVRGDATIIANNMLSRTATGDYTGSDGNHDFTDNVYVDIDTDATTFNSSSANFSNPEPQLTCLSMYRAFLYWAAADRENDDGTDNQPTWNYNDVKLMLPGQTTYTSITADDIIYRGRNTHFSNDPYICFKDITAEVQNLADPYGKYQVANVEAREGSLVSHPSGNTGTSGGWQIVFVYESPELPSKNISLFDGYAHVTNGVSGVDKDFDITFGGFQTVPTGTVNADVIIGSLEGDQDLSGDRLQIRNVANTFVDLSAPQRPNTNFFNSRITVGNSDFLDRNPASTNTLGFDASVFPLNNPGNSIITNNQTSATLRLTSNQETYGLYLVGFSVDVWAPDLDPIEIMLNAGNNPVDAGGSLGLTFNVSNKGNDDAIDLTLTANLPPQIVNVIANNLPAGVTFTFDSNTGSLIFTFDDDIVEVGDPELDIDFELVVQDECYFLEDSCDLDFELQFKADYTGVQNPNPQTTVSSSGLDDCNIGNMLPYAINVNQPDAALWANPVGDLDRTLECNDNDGLTAAQALEPITDKCDFTLTKTSGSFVVDPNCPEAGTLTNTWTFTDACGTTIADYVQTITITSATNLAFAEALPSDITVECDAIPDAETLTATISCGNATVAYNETNTPGSCPGNYTLTRTWTASDECGNEIEHTQTITVEDTTAPTFNESPLPSDETVDIDSIPNAETLTASDNCGNATVEFNEVMNGSVCDTSYTLVRTWTATDECDLTTVHTQTITVVPVPLQAIIVSITDVLCNSEATGAIDITVTGGTAPYTFAWNNGATSEDLSGVLAGAYNVTVTDANGCTTTINATVSEPANPLSINISKIDANTAQGCTNGEATVSVTGGTPDYTYLWSASTGNQTTATATNLTDGTHSVTVTDANGCELTQSIVIECVNTCDAEISIDNVVNVLCTGDATGSGIVSANSNANPSATFTFTWSNGQVDSGVTTSTLNNITSGVYTVSVTIDGTVCQPVEDTISITEPSNALSLAISATDELGPSTSDGTATVVATGGVEPYTYLWTPGGETTDSISGLSAGEYCVTVTDANGCTDNVCVTVNPGSCLNLSISGSSTPVVCNGESNGSVTSVVSGGIGPFSYAWDTLPNTTTSISNLPAGNYTVTVTDATTQCTQSTTITINEPNELSSGIAVSNILCKNESTGSLDLTVNGGTTPYSFLWSDGSTDEDLINVSNGTYSVTITDANGCVTTNQATIIEPDEVVSGSITAQTNVDCLGNATGEVTVEGAGGISPYSYVLDGGASQTSGTFSGLTAGDYVITVTDANGCTFDIPVTITEPSQALEATLVSITDVLCNSEATGAIDINITGGTEPYTFLWNNGVTTEDLSGVTAGAYNVTITDENGCTTSINTIISEPDSPLSINISKIDANTAQGCTNGEATVSVTGGTPDYTYAWSASAGNQTTATATNLPDGTHSVTVTDANGCELTQSIVIECVNTCDAEISINSVVDVLCTGDNTGSGTVSANSNANPSATFTFTWSNGQVDSGVTSSTLTNVTAGVYTVSVTIDGTVCQPVEDTISITEPSNALNVTITATDELGPGTADGTATAVVTGGVEPYTYVWTPGGETIDSISGLAAGQYCVTVTDANGCTDDICVTVNPGSCLNLSISGSSTPVVCNGESNGSVTSTVSGGVGPFTYAWDSLPDTTASISNLPAGDYTVTVTDATTQCTQSTTITINEPNELSSGIAVTNILCKNESTGSLDLTVNGGTAPYSFVWSDGSTDEDLINVLDGTYSVTITDANGCVTTNQATVVEPDEVVSGAIVDQTNVDCLGNATGEVTVEGAGGISPYSYVLDGGASQTSGTFSGLTAGDYVITVTDANGCTFDIPVTITTDDTEAPEIIVPSEITIEGCSISDITAANSIFDFSDVTSSDVQSIFDSNPDYNGSDDFEIESITYIDVIISTDNCPIIVQRTFTITDTCGNTANAIQTITVQDTTAPTIDTEASDLTVECNGNGNTDQLNDWLNSFGGANATDDCSTITWSNDFSSLSDECGTTGSATITFTATDECGNTITTSATFTIEDTTAPVIDTEASDLTVECDGNGNVDQLNDWLNAQGGSATASDSCGNVIWSNDFSSLSDECGATGSATVTFTATDDCGNTSTSSATFTIEDTTAPVIDTEASDLTVECDGNGNVDQLNDWLNSQGGSATASDTCGNVTWSNNFNSLSDDCGATGSATVTFTATDECGNTITTSATFTIEDTTAPVIDTEASDLTVECDGNGNVDQLNDWLNSQGGSATASDTCGNVTWSNDFSALSDECGATGSATVTFIATDDCGNTSTTSATFTIEDTTAPVIDTEASDLTVECDGNGNVDQLNDWLNAQGGSATASDTCGNVTWSNDFSGFSDDCGATGAATILFTATDDCGNTITTSATFTIEDTTAPTIDVEASDIVVECDGAGNNDAIQDWLDTFGGASASDECSNITWSNDYNGATSDCSAPVTVIFTATDECGNTITTSASYAIEDTTAPVIDTEASDLTVECDGNGNTDQLNDWLNSFGGANATDDCSTITWSNDFSSLSDECGATGSATVTFTATDGCGNTSTSSATFTIEDTTAPTIDTEASDLTVECDGNGNTDQLNDWLNAQGGSATASDSCGNVTWSNDFSSLSDDCGATGSATVTFTATDDCGNTSTSSATFTIEDTTAPTIDTEASDLTVECDGNGNVDQLNDWLNTQGGSATASDSCGNVTWSNDFSSLSDECGATGSATITFTATDDCGNTSTSSATFTIEDTTAPVIDTEASDLTVECDGNGNVDQLNDWLNSQGGSATASDTCGNVTWSNNFNSLSDDCGATGSATVTFTATDDCGNTITTSATFTIEDTTAPVIDTEASDLTVECDGNGNTDQLNDWLNSQGGSATASDSCSNVTWSNDFSALSDDCGATGSATVTFTATDDCGNTSTTSATFTIEDTTAPVIDTEASDLTVECDGNGNTDQLNDWLNSQGGSATASDSCSNVTWSNDFSALSDDCGATGSATVTFTATDDCGNTSTTSATFTIEDTTAPVIDTEASDLTVECDGNGNIGQLNDWLNSQGGAIAQADECSDITWTNNFDGSLSDDCGETGSVVVIFRVFDECSNVTTTTATFTIEDTTAPSFNETLPTDITVECDGIPTAETLTASDDCSETTITFNEDQTDGACAGEFTLTRTWTATDECGNEFVHVQTITVQDTSAPTFTVPADLTIECDEDATDLNLTGDVTDEADNCASGLQATFTDTVQDGSCANESIITRTWSLADDCGNTTTLTQIITVQDSTAPTFVENLPGDITLECDGVTDAETLTAIDNCGDATVTFVETQADGSCPSNYTLTRVWTATDECGNTTVHTQVVTVEDTTAPTVVGDFVDTIDIVCAEIPEIPNLIFEDACSSNMTVNFEETSTSDGSTDDYQIFWEWTVSDDCGNTAVFTTTINVTVEDNVTGGNDSLCITEDIEYDLFNLLSGDYDLDGEWTVTSGMASLDGSIFNPSDLLDTTGNYTDADLGDYIFTYTTMGDCPTSTDVIINIHEDCVVLACMDPDTFSFSKAVTPNGDQHNEYFEVTGTDRCNFTIELQLYNRWGALIYENKNYTNEWNGFVSSNSLGSSGQVPTGTYYYIVNLKNSGLKPFSGYIYVGTK